MSRDGSNVWTPPAGSSATAGTTIESAKYNALIADIAADLNLARPIVAGGTGASTAGQALVNLGLTATAAEINVLDGITATVAELNILDGVTTTATELNYVDGVTSAIQTQLNAKAPYPTASAGAGNWDLQSVSASNAFILPASGTLAWFYLRRTTPGNTISAIDAGVSAGGTNILTLGANEDLSALVWRIA